MKTNNIHIAYLVIKTIVIARVKNGCWSNTMNYWTLAKTVIKLIVNPYYRPSNNNPK